VSEVAEPARLSGVVPSPQSTEMALMVPSLSEQEKFTVIIWPVLAVAGDTEPIVHVGGTSVVTVTVTCLERVPVLPELSVTVNWIVNVVVEDGL